jgi:hypothetical protein
MNPTLPTALSESIGVYPSPLEGLFGLVRDGHDTAEFHRRHRREMELWIERLDAEAERHEET